MNGTNSVLNSLGLTMNDFITDTIIYIAVSIFINYWLTANNAKEYRKMLIFSYSILGMFFNSVIKFLALSVIFIAITIGVTMIG